MKNNSFKIKLWYKLFRYSEYFLSDKNYLKFQYRYRTGKRLDLSNPTSFTAKMQWLKLYAKHDEYAIMVDKAEAKDYASSIIGNEYIIPTIGIWNIIDEINWDALPNKFVLKATNDSSGVIVCRNKSKLDWLGAKKFLIKKGNRNFSRYTKEYPYEKVPHRYIAEQLLSDPNNSVLRDYKFFCFSGRAEYCQVIGDRDTNETIDFYDRNWKHQPFIGLNDMAQHASVLLEEPKNFNEMLKVADKLSSAISAPFVRIDLYNIDGKIYFGEITFFPFSGFGKFTPEEWDIKLGSMIKLPSVM